MLRLMLCGLLCVALVGGCTTVNVTPDGSASKSASSSSTSTAAAGDKAAAKKKSPFKPWKEVLEDTKAYDGYFKTHLKRDHSLYLELQPEQLGKEFGMVMHFSRGVGVYNVHDGLPLSDMRLMKFERVGDQVYLVHVNPRFTADAGSAMRRSLDDNTGHSIVEAFKIESEDSTSNAVLIDATSFFVSDYADVSEQLKFYYGQKPVQYDKGRSYLRTVMGFPKNVEVDVVLTYKSGNTPITSAAGVSDYRSIPVGVRYSLVALPEEPLQPRYADDRVGHFLDAVRDFSRDKETTPYLRFVNRWRLEPSDPDAFARGEKVEPREPIVYYVDRSVPEAYRTSVKAGIEAWNRAFEAAGFKNAIVAKDAPDDSTWSAEDARYSTVRWTAAHSMGYAIGPSQTDPRTGEIINADVLISSTFVTGWNNEYQEMIGEEGMLTRYRQAQQLLRQMPAEAAARTCLYEMGKTQQLGFLHAALVSQGRIGGVDPMPETYLGDAIRDLVMHEVGHTLGLRHNFKGSSAIPYDKLNDKAFTGEHGLSLSVMDYAATNIALDPQEQGDFVNRTVGSYDVWAIRYAYTPFFVREGTNGHSEPRPATSEEEMEHLREIAEEAAEPMHAYNTDEDTHLGPMALDPSSNTWDLGSDPMRYAGDRAKLVAKIQPRIEERLIAEGEGFQRLRGAVNGLLFEKLIALLPVMKNVGGHYFARDHRDDPDGRMPFTPVAATQQREAVQLIIDTAFKPGAFHVEGDLLNKMPPNRYADWASAWYTSPIDYPVHDVVAYMQGWLVDDLLDNGRLARMIDNEVRMPAGQDAYTVAELMETLTGAIFTEVDTSPETVDSFRRNLQRAYLNRLIGIMLDERPYPWIRPAPEDARSLARYQLVQLNDRMAQALQAGGFDVTTRAHLMESQARIAQAMDAQLSREVK